MSHYGSLEPLVPWKERSLPLDWAAEFGRSAPLKVEIGFGNGDFLVRSALEDPASNYIGIEMIPPCGHTERRHSLRPHATSKPPHAPTPPRPHAPTVHVPTVPTPATYPPLFFYRCPFLASSSSGRGSSCLSSSAELPWRLLPVPTFWPSH